jgi:hypothetical protein
MQDNWCSYEKVETQGQRECHVRMEAEIRVREKEPSEGTNSADILISVF